MSDQHDGQLRRHFGPLHATAVNVTMIVGAGIFITVPYMLQKLPGPYAILGWVGAGVLILLDSFIWSELSTMMPGSGGSYLYLLQSFGKDSWGRLLAFLFIWQFMLSGPLELASGLIAMDQFAQSFHPAYAALNSRYTFELILLADPKITMILSPGRAIVFAIGLLLIMLLYRNIESLGRLTVTLWLGVLAILAWVGLTGLMNFSAARALDTTAVVVPPPIEFAWGLGGAMILAMYSYLGYYNVCYMGGEVHNPGRTLPIAIFLSAALVAVLFTTMHVLMTGVVPWQSIPTTDDDIARYSLPAEMMRIVYGDWAASVITALLLWSCFGAAFAGLLGYSRIPYGAAAQGHFFRIFARVHPTHRIPHLGLFFVGGLTLFWTFFDLSSVINALIATRILEQFIAQTIGLMILRRTQPSWPRPFRVPIYPLVCGLVIAGWIFLYLSAGWPFIMMGLAVLGVGVAVFLFWSWTTGGWPFATG